MIPTRAYAAADAKTPLGLFRFDRRATGAGDVAIEIDYCGVCHTDLHIARNEWGATLYPCVPGHEIIGRVVEVGANVTRFRPGDRVGVGCMVDSCGHCVDCVEGEEQFCTTGRTLTYNSPDPKTGGHTFGGYASHITVREKFVLRVPDGLDPASAAPLLCAGITTYSPLKHWKVGPGTRLAVVGLGGLGHMAVKIGHAMGAEVTLITTTPSKLADGGRLGATQGLLSTDDAAMADAAGQFDIIIDTVAANHDLNSLFALLRRDGTLVQVGVPSEPQPVAVRSLMSRRRNFTASNIGGIRETQEMLDFCAAHGITADIELIGISDIENAWDRMLRGHVKYRFVIDMRSL